MKLTAMVAVLVGCASYISYGQGAKYLVEMEKTSLGPGKDYDIGIKSVNRAPLMQAAQKPCNWCGCQVPLGCCDECPSGNRVAPPRTVVPSHCKICGLGVKGAGCCPSGNRVAPPRKAVSTGTSCKIVKGKWI